MSNAQICCICLSSVVLLTLFINMILSLENSKPRCYIQDLYVPGLNTNLNSNITRGDHFIFFDLQLKNVMDKGIHYDNLNLTFFYGMNAGPLPVANYVAPGFKQGVKKTAQHRDVVEAHGVPWETAFETVSNGSTVVFRVELVTKIKYSYFFFSSKRKVLNLEGYVKVDSSGQKVQKKAIRLKSRPSKMQVSQETRAVSSI